jgi:hypothetical protein
MPRNTTTRKTTARRTAARNTAARKTAARKATLHKPRRRSDPRPAAAQPVVRLARVAKGKKPQYFSDPAIDKLLWMTLTLMEELSVTRDRLDAVERLLASKKLLKRAELEGWKPDAAAAAERAAARSAYVDRMMRAMHAELEEIAGRGMPKSEAEIIAAVEA